MFSRFTTALYNAVDALAPPLPLQEDFVWHWKSITRYFTSKDAAHKISIEGTRIPGHLLEMLSILTQEGKELELGSIGPCMEYIMKHKLLDTMFVLATSDSPPGMKRFMLIFMTRLLKMMQQFLIPHVGIYIPVTKFVNLCGEILAAPTEKEEIDFLEAICDRLTENPHLVNCFMGLLDDESTVKSIVHGKSETSNGGPFKTETCSYKPEEKHYNLISSILMLFTSPDNTISARAGECLKTCCSLANDAVAFAIVKNTNLSVSLCKCVLLAYNSVPKNMKLSEIEDPIQEFTDENSSVPSASQISPSRRKFLCYLKTLHFFDTVIQQAHPVISDDLTANFRSTILESVFKLDLVSSDDAVNNLFCTAVISTSLRHLSSSKFISAFGLFLLGDMESFDLSGHSSHIVKDLLITRCQNSEENTILAIATLQLFEELLQQPNEFILNNLINSYLEGRGYYDHTVSDDWFCFSDDDNSSICIDESLSNNESSSTNKTFAPPYIHRILDAFLSLLPEEIKSAESEEDSGYDTYIKEARCRFMKCLMLCEDFDWPQEPLTKEDYHLSGEDDSNSDSQPEADSCWRFYEGPFLSMIFDKIEHMLDLPYDINLQVTSLVSRLALLAHPNLHEYLLNPLIPYGSNVRSLFSVLLVSVGNIQEAVKDVKSFRQKIRLTRKSLLCDGCESEPFPESHVLEALIVFEEFCKELAAIAFVKYNAAS